MKELKKYAEATFSYDKSRRKFLSGGAILSVSAVAIAIAPNVAVATAKQEPEVDKNKKEEGYRLTKHIADYYKSAAL